MGHYSALIGESLGKAYILSEGVTWPPLSFSAHPFISAFRGPTTTNRIKSRHPARPSASRIFLIWSGEFEVG